MGFWSFITGAPSQEEGDLLDARLRELNQQDRARYGERWYAQTEENIGLSYTDVDASVEAAFDEGLEEGADNLTNVLRKPFQIVGTGIGAILRAVPLWVWLLIAVYLFLSLGGLGWLKSKRLLG